MRRWAAAFGLALVLVLAGCANGDITDGWTMMPAAKQFRPAAGTCHRSLNEVVPLSDKAYYQPVPCTGEHSTETVAVFDLTPAQAATPESRHAAEYAECSRRTTAWLGKDWRSGWTTIVPMLPSDLGWTAGARWVRCDVGEVKPETGVVIARKGSLKGALKHDSKLLATCANPTFKNSVATALRPVSCARPHTAEFAGLYVSKKKTMDGLTDAEYQKGCYPVIAKFAGVPDDALVSYRSGWMTFLPSYYGWERGDHAFRCFLYFDNRVMVGSYRNAGPGRLPVR